MSDVAALSILIVDDDASLRKAIALNVQAAGFTVAQADNAQVALDMLRKEKHPVVLCDLRMPDMGGLEFTKKCREEFPETAVVLMTGYGNSELALDALRAGAYDYISKPFEMEELIFLFQKIQERERLRRENEQLKAQTQQAGSNKGIKNFIAQSKCMLELIDTVQRLAPFHTTVLITGESGTGKELIAQAIHDTSSRQKKPFIAINCGAIPEALMESELFGHRKGSFTDASRDKRGLFEEADGGTLFLDEIGEMPLQLQVKLLRALQERKIRRVGDDKLIDVDVRVIAATLRNLEDDVKTGRFREDLFYRLNVVSLHVPPLRERPEDIPVLIEHFVKKYSKRFQITQKAFHADSLKMLLSYHWRGNVRELENCIERALVLSDGDTILPDSLPIPVRESGKKTSNDPFQSLLDDENLSIKQMNRGLEIALIKRALEKTGGNRTHAAKMLELSHRALLYKLKEYEIG